MIPGTVAAKAAAKIGRERFASLYCDLRFTTGKVARELGVPVHQLPHIAVELNLPTRKRSGARFQPTKAAIGNEETVPFHSGDCDTCPVRKKCSLKLVPLPCEVFMYFDERGTIK